MCQSFCISILLFYFINLKCNALMNQYTRCIWMQMHATGCVRKRVLLTENCVNSRYYFPRRLSGIGEYRKGFSWSICLSVSQSSRIPPWWLDGFSAYWVPWWGTMAADACKIKFDSVPNLSNYGNFFINVQCLLWYLGDEGSDFVHIW